jgi:hypothetical protein
MKPVKNEFRDEYLAEGFVVDLSFMILSRLRAINCSLLFKFNLYLVEGDRAQITLPAIPDIQSQKMVYVRCTTK